MSLNFILFVLLFPVIVKDALLDVDYRWWRRWIGEKPGRS